MPPWVSTRPRSSRRINYRLGVPGKSAGLDIATRLELPAPLCWNTRASVLPKLQADFQQLLVELNKQTDENARLGRELEQVHARI